MLSKFIPHNTPSAWSKHWSHGLVLLQNKYSAGAIKLRNLPFTEINRGILNSSRFTTKFLFTAKNHENCYCLIAKFGFVKNNSRLQNSSQVPQLCLDETLLYKWTEKKLKYLFQNWLFAIAQLVKL